MIRIFVPRDAAALSVGADEVAIAIASEAKKRNLDLQIVRNGSRGMLYLEPLVEVDIPGGRVAYGPVAPDDVAGLFDAGFLEGKDHALSHGPYEEIPLLQEPGKADVRALRHHRSALDRRLPRPRRLRRAFESPAHEAHRYRHRKSTTSGLRGRGGAGFPTGIKWKTVHDLAGAEKYVACNADEGDSGTFADRMLMEGDPFCLIEGMTIAAVAGNAAKGYIYVRSEYPHAVHVLREAIEVAKQANWLGDNIQGTKYSFDLFVRMGAGAYICGEETSMLESIEGKRGIVRYKPPIPAIEGLFGKPTIINNVMSFAAVPIIIAKGGEFYKNYGVGRSRGTLAFQIAGNIKQGGLVEKAFGVTTRQLIEDWGGGTATGRPVRAVQVGGPAWRPTFRNRSSTCRWITRNSPRSTPCRPRRSCRFRRHCRYG